MTQFTVSVSVSGNVSITVSAASRQEAVTMVENMETREIAERIGAAEFIESVQLDGPAQVTDILGEVGNV